MDDSLSFYMETEMELEAKNIYFNSNGDLVIETDSSNITLTNPILISSVIRNNDVDTVASEIVQDDNVTIRFKC